jgi:hypothetical protein
VTRPPQPQPYPGDLPTPLPIPVPVVQGIRSPYKQTFRDAAGALQEGEAIIRHPSGDIRVPIVAGELEVPLEPGHYQLLATLFSSGGVAYRTDSFEVIA